MRKDNSKDNKSDKDFREFVHDEWDKLDDEMDRQELKGFINPNNTPKFKELNEDDRIGVNEVLLIGSYLTLNKLHHETHKREVQETLDVSANVVVIGGKNGAIPEEALKDLPPEVRDIVKNIADNIKKKKGKK